MRLSVVDFTIPTDTRQIKFSNALTIEKLMFTAQTYKVRLCLPLMAQIFRLMLIHPNIHNYAVITHKKQTKSH